MTKRKRNKENTKKDKIKEFKKVREKELESESE